MKKTLSDIGFLRIKQIVPNLVPISRSGWWAGVKTGRFPKPIKLSPRVTVWRASDIRQFLAGDGKRVDDEDARNANAQELRTQGRSKTSPPGKAMM